MILNRLGAGVPRGVAGLGYVRAPTPPTCVAYVFYAKTAEAWRIDAYIMMMVAAAKAGWNEGFERLEGTLLGYQEWQNDVHIERLRASPHAKNFYWVRRPQSGAENAGTETGP